MAAAVALQRDDVLEQHTLSPSRAEVLARYRQLREISKRHNTQLMNFLPPGAILHQARRLGLAAGKTIMLDREDDLNFVFDLAIHTAEVGRSRAVDRYARSAGFAPGSEEARVLQAMRAARFGILTVERLHPSAGLIVRDVIRKLDVWVVDEGLETSVQNGATLATRTFAPDGFAMTAGIIVPVDGALLESVLHLAPQLARKQVHEAIDDRRFAEAVYRAALEDGIMDQVAYRDPCGARDRA